eukprot:TRINITY_DN225_c0_g4_i6.p1 TRINITY_DN225_c0_g4~~TRINITY_DN225_c0_g4_i6.p1  ORF type:complete len:296 (+),score=31.18 TRINITY_DN225_c0_g4_i6:10-897(+)
MMLQPFYLLEAYLPYQVQEAFLQQTRRPVRIIGLSTSLILLSTLMTWLMFVLCEVVSPRLSPGYRALKRQDQVGWSTRVASTIHAVVVTLLSLYTLWTETVLYEQPLLARTGLGEVAMCITIGYLLGDFVLIVLHFDTLDTPSLNRQTMLHHVCGIVGFAVCLQYGACQYFGLFRLLSEASTPFLNARWFLDKLQLKQSRLYMFNGVLLAAVFFQSRIFVMPLYWHRMWVFRDQILVGSARSLSLSPSLLCPPALVHLPCILTSTCPLHTRPSLYSVSRLLCKQLPLSFPLYSMA